MYVTNTIFLLKSLLANTIFLSWLLIDCAADQSTTMLENDIPLGLNGCAAHQSEAMLEYDSPSAAILTDILQAAVSLTRLAVKIDNSEYTFTTFEIRTLLSDLILGINPCKLFCVWPVWAEEPRYRENKTVISLSIDRQLNIWMMAWTKVGAQRSKPSED